MLIFVLFSLAIGIRLQRQQQLAHHARIVYAITLMLAYLRFMENFYVSKMIGPKIIMIQRMVGFFSF